MARKTGQSASPTARPRPARENSVLNVPGKKGGPMKSSTVVPGRGPGGFGHK